VVKRLSFLTKEKNMSEKNCVVIKFEQVADQSVEGITRLVGFVKARNFIGIIDSSGDLVSNPRSAKTGRVVTDILESIEKDAATFPFKTKGVLLAAASCDALDRKRYRLHFEGDGESVEGILDGGHNTLALGIHIIRESVGDPKAVSSIKLWQDLRAAWDTHRKAIGEHQKEFDFLVPVEIIVPQDPDSEEGLSTFRSSIFGICEARNNNVQLTAATKANQLGLYNELRTSLDADISEHVEWKTNDGGRIRVDDIIALAWIPLLKLELLGVKIQPVQIYSSKGQCVKAFTQFMEQDHVTNDPGADYKKELKNPLVLSAFQVLRDLPRLYDQIYESLPDCYNAAEGSFGRIKGVKQFAGIDRFKQNKESYLRTRPLTPFYQREVRYKYPDGFMVPLVYGLSALMEVRDGSLDWITDPAEFVKKHLEQIMRSFKLPIKMANWDPQKVGKSSEAYQLALTLFQSALDGERAGRS
jgi:hypothetical protein